MSSPLRRTARSASTATKRLLDTTKREIKKLKETAAGRGRATSQELLKQLKGGRSNLSELARKVLLPHIPVLQKKYPDSSQEVSRRIITKWNTLRKILPLKGSSVGNKVEIYADGSLAFSSMWESISKAKHRVWIQTFILEPDPVGLRMIAELTAAAKRGCQVAVIYDFLGSFGIRNKHLQELRLAGGIAIPFHNVLQLPWWREHPLRRNHRKVLVVDDVEAFCGGMNVSQDYAGVEVGGTGRFRDTHAKIEGPAVLFLARVFLDTLNTAKKLGSTDLPPNLLNDFGPLRLTESGPTLYDNGSVIQVLSSDARGNTKRIQKQLTMTIRHAQDHVYLTTPYFVPPRSLRTAIVNAARRGLDVRIITAGKCDVKASAWASQHVYGVFLRNGVRLYEMQNRELHAKTATVDNIFAGVGSYNLDYLSYSHMLETNLNIMDSRMAEVLEKQFHKDVENCREIKLETWENRPWYLKLFHWFAYHVYRFFLSVRR